MPKTSTKKRSKIARILLAPALAIVFGIGWCLYCIGQPRQKKTQNPKNTTQPKHENIQLMMIPQEEKLTVTN